ncbi:MAG: hypothetical protein GY858_01740, partial [Candidatus Omnitrophica bacterium]|nr:hypothetical protein [Candidatus Omnitrophota bacterium]
ATGPEDNEILFQRYVGINPGSDVNNDADWNGASIPYADIALGLGQADLSGDIRFNVVVIPSIFGDIDEGQIIIEGMWELGEVNPDSEFIASNDLPGVIDPLEGVVFPADPSPNDVSDDKANWYNIETGIRYGASILRYQVREDPAKAVGTTKALPANLLNNIYTNDDSVHLSFYKGDFYIDGTNGPSKVIVKFSRDTGNGIIEYPQTLNLNDPIDLSDGITSDDWNGYSLDIKKIGQALQGSLSTWQEALAGEVQFSVIIVGNLLPVIAEREGALTMIGILNYVHYPYPAGFEAGKGKDRRPTKKELKLIKEAFGDSLAENKIKLTRRNVRISPSLRSFADVAYETIKVLRVQPSVLKDNFPLEQRKVIFQGHEIRHLIDEDEKEAREYTINYLTENYLVAGNEMTKNHYELLTDQTDDLEIEAEEEWLYELEKLEASFARKSQLEKDLKSLEETASEIGEAANSLAGVVAELEEYIGTRDAGTEDAGTKESAYIIDVDAQEYSVDAGVEEKLTGSVTSGISVVNDVKGVRLQENIALTVDKGIHHSELTLEGYPQRYMLDVDYSITPLPEFMIGANIVNQQYYRRSGLSGTLMSAGRLSEHGIANGSFTIKHDSFYGSDSTAQYWKAGFTNDYTSVQVWGLNKNYLDNWSAGTGTASSRGNLGFNIGIPVLKSNLTVNSFNLWGDNSTFANIELITSIYDGLIEGFFSNIPMVYEDGDIKEYQAILTPTKPFDLKKFVLKLGYYGYQDNEDFNFNMLLASTRVSFDHDISLDFGIKSTVDTPWVSQVFGGAYWYPYASVGTKIGLDKFGLTTISAGADLSISKIVTDLTGYYLYMGLGLSGNIEMARRPDNRFDFKAAEIYAMAKFRGRYNAYAGLSVAHRFAGEYAFDQDQYFISKLLGFSIGMPTPFASSIDFKANFPVASNSDYWSFFASYSIYDFGKKTTTQKSSEYIPYRVTSHEHIAFDNRQKALDAKAAKDANKEPTTPANMTAEQFAAKQKQKIQIIAHFRKFRDSLGDGSSRYPILAPYLMSRIKGIDLENLTAKDMKFLSYIMISARGHVNALETLEHLECLAGLQHEATPEMAGYIKERFDINLLSPDADTLSALGDNAWASGLCYKHSGEPTKPAKVMIGLELINQIRVHILSDPDGFGEAFEILYSINIVDGLDTDEVEMMLNRGILYEISGRSRNIEELVENTKAAANLLAALQSDADGAKAVWTLKGYVIPKVGKNVSDSKLREFLFKVLFDKYGDRVKDFDEPAKLIEKLKIAAFFLSELRELSQTDEQWLRYAFHSMKYLLGSGPLESDKEMQALWEQLYGPDRDDDGELIIKNGKIVAVQTKAYKLIAKGKSPKKVFEHMIIAAKYLKAFRDYISRIKPVDRDLILFTLPKLRFLLSGKPLGKEVKGSYKGIEETDALFNQLFSPKKDDDGKISRKKGKIVTEKTDAYLLIAKGQSPEITFTHMLIGAKYLREFREFMASLSGRDRSLILSTFPKLKRLMGDEGLTSTRGINALFEQLFAPKEDKDGKIIKKGGRIVTETSKAYELIASGKSAKIAFKYLLVGAKYVKYLKRYLNNILTVSEREMILSVFVDLRHAVKEGGLTTRSEIDSVFDQLFELVRSDDGEILYRRVKVIGKDGKVTYTKGKKITKKSKAHRLIANDKAPLEAFDDVYAAAKFVYAFRAFIASQPPVAVREAFAILGALNEIPLENGVKTPDQSFAVFGQIYTIKFDSEGEIVRVKTKGKKRKPRLHLNHEGKTIEYNGQIEVEETKAYFHRSRARAKNGIAFDSDNPLVTDEDKLTEEGRLQKALNDMFVIVRTVKELRRYFAQLSLIKRTVILDVFPEYADLLKDSLTVQEITFVSWKLWSRFEVSQLSSIPVPTGAYKNPVKWFKGFLRKIKIKSCAGKSGIRQSDCKTMTLKKPDLWTSDVVKNVSKKYAADELKTTNILGFTIDERFKSKDVSKLKEIKGNTIRTYDLIRDKDLLKALADAGYKVIMGVPYKHWSSKDRAKRLLKYIEEYKGHPAIFMWELGNEYNYQVENWEVFHEDYRILYNSMEMTAREIYGIDKDNLVSVAWGDTFKLQEAVKACPAIDVWGLNVYRWDSPAYPNNLFAEWLEIIEELDREIPMYISEAGVDSFDNRMDINREDQKMQAEFNVNIWHAIRQYMDQNSRIFKGVTFMALKDNWSKAGNKYRHNTGAEKGTFESKKNKLKPNGFAPDMVSDEEWYGFLDKNGKEKLVFAAMAKEWSDYLGGKEYKLINYEERNAVRPTELYKLIVAGKNPDNVFDYIYRAAKLVKTWQELSDGKRKAIIQKDPAFKKLPIKGVVTSALVRKLAFSWLFGPATAKERKEVKARTAKNKRIENMNRDGKNRIGKAKRGATVKKGKKRSQGKKVSASKKKKTKWKKIELFDYPAHKKVNKNAEAVETTDKHMRIIKESFGAAWDEMKNAGVILMKDDITVTQAAAKLVTTKLENGKYTLIVDPDVLELSLRARRVIFQHHEARHILGRGEEKEERNVLKHTLNSGLDNKRKLDEHITELYNEGVIIDSKWDFMLYDKVTEGDSNESKVQDFGGRVIRAFASLDEEDKDRLWKTFAFLRNVPRNGRRVSRVAEIKQLAMILYEWREGRVVESRGYKYPRQAIDDLGAFAKYLEELRKNDAAVDFIKELTGYDFSGNRQIGMSKAEVKKIRFLFTQLYDKHGERSAGFYYPKESVEILANSKIYDYNFEGKPVKIVESTVGGKKKYAVMESKNMKSKKGDILDKTIITGVFFGRLYPYREVANGNFDVRGIGGLLVLEQEVGTLRGHKKGTPILYYGSRNGNIAAYNFKKNKIDTRYNMDREDLIGWAIDEGKYTFANPLAGRYGKFIIRIIRHIHAQGDKQGTLMKPGIIGVDIKTGEEVAKIKYWNARGKDLAFTFKQASFHGNSSISFTGDINNDGQIIKKHLTSDSKEGDYANIVRNDAWRAALESILVYIKGFANPIITDSNKDFVFDWTLDDLVWVSMNMVAPESLGLSADQAKISDSIQAFRYSEDPLIKINEDGFIDIAFAHNEGIVSLKFATDDGVIKLVALSYYLSDTKTLVIDFHSRIAFVNVRDSAYKHSTQRWHIKVLDENIFELGNFTSVPELSNLNAVVSIIDGAKESVSERSASSTLLVDVIEQFEYSRSVERVFEIPSNPQTHARIFPENEDTQTDQDAGASVGSQRVAITSLSKTKIFDRGPPQVKTNGFELIVDGQVYQVRGVTVDEYFTSNDIPALVELGVNTIRTYFPINSYLLNDLERAGIKAIIGIPYDEEAYISVGLPKGPNLKDESHLEYIKNLKNHPAILMWEFGNEYNLFPKWFKDNDIRNWYRLLAQTAAEIKGIHVQTLEVVAPAIDNRPISTVFGVKGGVIDLGGAVEALMSYVDVFGFNFYNWNDVDIFTEWQQITEVLGKDIPMYFGEVGVDSFDNKTGAENEAEQARVTARIWTKANNRQDICLGATFMAWKDNWAKAGDPTTQDEYGDKLVGAGFDNYDNPEYWGFVKRDGTKKQVYVVMQRAWGGVIGSAKNLFVAPPSSFKDAIDAAEYVLVSAGELLRIDWENKLISSKNTAVLYEQDQVRVEFGRGSVIVHRDFKGNVVMQDFGRGAITYVANFDKYGIGKISLATDVDRKTGRVVIREISVYAGQDERTGLFAFLKLEGLFELNDEKGKKIVLSPQPGDIAKNAARLDEVNFGTIYRGIKSVTLSLVDGEGDMKAVLSRHRWQSDVEKGEETLNEWPLLRGGDLISNIDQFKGGLMALMGEFRKVTFINSFVLVHSAYEAGVARLGFGRGGFTYPLLHDANRNVLLDSQFYADNIDPLGKTYNLSLTNVSNAVDGSGVRFVYDVSDTKVSKGSLQERALDIAGRVRWEVFEGTFLTGPRMKMVYDLVYGVADKTYQVGFWKTGFGKSEKILKYHATIYESDNLGNWLVFDVDAKKDIYWHYDEFKSGNQALLDKGKILLLDSEAAITFAQRDGKHFFLGTQQYDIESMENPEVWVDFDGEFGEYTAILVTKHTPKNSVLANVFRPQVWFPSFVIIGFSIVFKPLTLILFIIFFISMLSFMHFRNIPRFNELLSSTRKRTTAVLSSGVGVSGASIPLGISGHVPVASSSPFSAFVRNRAYAINANLTVFIRDDFMAHIESLYLEVQTPDGMEHIKERYFGSKGNKLRDKIDSWYKKRNKGIKKHFGAGSKSTFRDATEKEKGKVKSTIKSAMKHMELERNPNAGRGRPTIRIVETDESTFYAYYDEKGHILYIEESALKSSQLKAKVRDALCLGDYKELERAIIIPMIFLCIIILGGEGLRWREFSCGEKRPSKSNDYGFIFMDFYLKDYISCCLAEGREPFVDSLRHGFPEYEKYVATNEGIKLVGQMRGRLKKRVTDPMCDYILGKYKENGLNPPQFPIIKNKWLRWLSYLKFSVGSASMKGLRSNDIADWAFVVFLFVATAFVAWQGYIANAIFILALAIFAMFFEPGPWLQAIITAWKTRNNYTGGLTQEEVKRKMHFLKVTMGWMIGSNLFIIFLSIYYSLSSFAVASIAIPLAVIVLILNARESIRSFYYTMTEAVAAASDKKEGWHHYKSYGQIDKEIIMLIAENPYLKDVYNEVMVDGTLRYYHFITKEKAKALKEALKSGVLPKLDNWFAENLVIDFFNKIKVYHNQGLSIDNISLEDLLPLKFSITAAFEQMFPKADELDRKIGMVMGQWKLITGKYKENWNIYVTDLLSDLSGVEDGSVHVDFGEELETKIDILINEGKIDSARALIPNVRFVGVNYDGSEVDFDLEFRSTGGSLIFSPIGGEVDFKDVTFVKAIDRATGGEYKGEYRAWMADLEHDVDLRILRDSLCVENLSFEETMSRLASSITSSDKFKELREPYALSTGLLQQAFAKNIAKYVGATKSVATSSITDKSRRDRKKKEIKDLGKTLAKGKVSLGEAVHAIIKHMEASGVTPEASVLYTKLYEKITADVESSKGKSLKRLVDPAKHQPTGAHAVDDIKMYIAGEIGYRVRRDWVSHHAWNLYRTTKETAHASYLNYKVFLRHKIGYEPTDDDIKRYLRITFAWAKPVESDIFRNEFMTHPTESWKVDDKSALRTVINAVDQGENSCSFIDPPPPLKMRGWAYNFPYIDDGSDKPGVGYMMDFVHSMYPSSTFMLPFDTYQFTKDPSLGICCVQLEVFDNEITPTIANQAMAEDNWNTRIIQALAKVSSHSFYGPGMIRINALRGNGTYFSNIEDSASGEEILLGGWRATYSGRTTLGRPREKNMEALPSFNNRFDGLVVDEWMGVRFQQIARSPLIHLTEKFGLFNNFDYYINNPLIPWYNMVIFVVAFFLSLSPFAGFAIPLFWINFQYLMALAICAGAMNGSVAKRGFLRGVIYYWFRFWSLVFTFLPLICVGAKKIRSALDGAAGVFTRGEKLMRWPMTPFRTGDPKNPGLYDLYRPSIKMGVFLLAVLLFTPFHPDGVTSQLFFYIFPFAFIFGPFTKNSMFMGGVPKAIRDGFRAVGYLIFKDMPLSVYAPAKSWYKKYKKKKGKKKKDGKKKKGDGSDGTGGNKKKDKDSSKKSSSKGSSGKSSSEPSDKKKDNKKERGPPKDNSPSTTPVVPPTPPAPAPPTPVAVPAGPDTRITVSELKEKGVTLAIIKPDGANATKEITEYIATKGKEKDYVIESTTTREKGKVTKDLW